MMTPLKRLPPLESQNLRTRIRRTPSFPRTHRFNPHHSRFRGVAWLLRNVTDARPLHNPVLTSNCAADNSPDSRRNRVSTDLIASLGAPAQHQFPGAVPFALDSGITLALIH